MVPKKFVGRRMLMHPNFPGLLPFERQIVQIAAKKKGWFKVREFAKQKMVSVKFVHDVVKKLNDKGFLIRVKFNEPKKKPPSEPRKRIVRLKRLP